MPRIALALALLLAAALGVAAGTQQIGRLLLAAGYPTLAALVFDDPAWAGAALLAAGRDAEAADALRRTASPEAAYNLGNALARTGSLDLAVKAYDLALARDPDDIDALANRALVQAAIAAAGVDADASGLGLANSGADIDHQSGRDDTSGDDNGAQSSSGDGMVGDRESGSDTETPGSGKVSRRGDARDSATKPGEGSSKGSATDAAGEAGEGGGATDMADSSDAAADRRETVVTREAQQATLQWLAAIPDDPARFLRLRIAAEHDRRVAAGTAVQPGGSGW